MIDAVSIDGIGVRHREDGGEAARGGGGGSRRDVLLVLLAGRAQVDVRIDERGQQRETVGLDDLRLAGRRDAFAEPGDHAVADEHVRDPVVARRGIEHARAADHQRRGSRDRGS